MAILKIFENPWSLCRKNASLNFPTQNSMILEVKNSEAKKTLKNPKETVQEILKIVLVVVM